MRLVGDTGIAVGMQQATGTSAEGCSDDTTPPPPPPPPPPPSTFSIVVISGPGSGAPGDTLTFVVEVRENENRAHQDQTVDFSIPPGDGNVSLGSTSETTGSNGRAQTTLILGNSASGSYTITATLSNDSCEGEWDCHLTTTNNILHTCDKRSWVWDVCC